LLAKSSQKPAVRRRFDCDATGQAAATVTAIARPCTRSSQSIRRDRFDSVSG
jgi:hypothetical protein